MTMERYRPSMPAEVLHSWAQDAQAENDRLRAQIDALRADAMRYQWLRSNCECMGWGSRSDAAIDAAMGAAGVPVAEYLAKVEADPRRAAALQRARERTASGVLGTGSAAGYTTAELSCLHNQAHGYGVALANADRVELIADLEHRARWWRQPNIGDFPVRDLAEDLARELDRAVAALRAAGVAAPDASPTPAAFTPCFDRGCAGCEDCIDDHDAAGVREGGNG